MDYEARLFRFEPIPKEKSKDIRRSLPSRIMLCGVSLRLFSPQSQSRCVSQAELASSTPCLVGYHFEKTAI